MLFDLSLKVAMTNNYIVGTVTDTSRKSYALEDHWLELRPNT